MKLDAIKKDLLKRRQELEEELSQLSKEHVYDEQVPDPSDAASASTIEDLAISLQNAKHVEYNRITKALEMIEQGNYGICTDCGNPISPKRLLMFPNATRCLICQEASEERTSL